MPASRDEEFGSKHSFTSHRVQEPGERSADGRPPHPHVSQAYRGLPKVLPMDGGAVATQPGVHSKFDCIVCRSSTVYDYHVSFFHCTTDSRLGTGRGPLGLGLDDIDSLVQKHSRSNDTPTARVSAQHPFGSNSSMTSTSAPRAIMMNRSTHSSSGGRAHGSGMLAIYRFGTTAFI